MVSETFAETYAAARRHHVAVPRNDHAWIVVSGKDRASYLQGLLTNDVSALAPGEGCYSAYLTPQGRMITDLVVYELGDVILLALPLQTRQAVLAKLDQFIFSEDVQLGDVTGAFAGVSVIGPAAPVAVAKVTGVPLETLEALPEHGNLRARFHDGSCIVLNAADRGTTAFDLLVDAGLRDPLLAALGQGGAVAADAAALEALRLEGGIPRFGIDMDEEIIPLEAGIEPRAISFTKGCYVGQEVIVRVLHRGHGRVAKKLVGLALSPGAVPAPGTVVETAEGKTIGKITSANWSPALDRPIALGYVHRDFAAPGTPVRVDGREAEVSALPFHQ